MPSFRLCCVAPSQTPSPPPSPAPSCHPRTVADRHSTDIAAVATRWVLSRPAVPAVLIGARNASHVPELQRVFAFELTAEDLAGIYAVLQRGAPAQGDCYEWERGGRW